jgi:hypothetical protein
MAPKWSEPRSAQRSLSGGSEGNCCLVNDGIFGTGIRVAIADSGAVVAMGANGSRACARLVSPAGLASTAYLSSGTPMAPALAVNAAGDALFAWIEVTPALTVTARARSAAGAWSSVLTAGRTLPGNIGVGLGSTGYGAVVLRPSSAAVSYAAFDGRTLQAPVNMSSFTGPAYFIDVGYDAHQPTVGVTAWQQGGTDPAGAPFGEGMAASRLGL